MSKRSVRHQSSTLKTITGEEVASFRPSEFMRARRPYLFSDSKIKSEPKLAREVFEYHLETLTNRKQEIEFEHFARKLTEKEICPNLIPQTGPTGGGDSKVDTETYPVSDEIALRWYVGTGNNASQERWAFAFSAKKDWRSKCLSDVEKIVATNRGYKVIYFITNQYVKDKARAAIEDELTKKHGVNVHILDRTWIVKCIYEHGRHQLAIEALNLADHSDTPTKIIGPHDTERFEELKLLEQQIEDPERYQGVSYQLAEDCLQAALLARNLELPRVEVEGRFDRAERIAQRIGHRQQQLRIVYNRAWSVHWWYDDFELFDQLYGQVEHLAFGTTQATDLEMVANLWHLLYADVRRNVLDEEKSKLKERTGILKTELHRLASDTNRQNNALHSQVNLLLVELIEVILSSNKIKPVIVDLHKALQKSKGLAEFPVASIIDIIRELGDILPDNSDFDDLFETVVRITEERASQGEAGIVLFERGLQKLKAGRPYDAITLLGRAQQKLALHEYRKEWISSIAGCGLAYEKAGLLWAARANFLFATSFALSEYWKHGEFIPPVLKYSQKLVWLELQLGRVPYVLSWIDFVTIIAPQVLHEKEEKEAFEQERNIQDFVLGMLLLKSDLLDLKRLNFLPEVLEDQDLLISWVSLLYALGHEEYLRNDGMIPPEESQEAVKDLFQKMLKQPANEDIPDKPNFFLDQKITFQSFILGCEVMVEAANNHVSITLAETVLGALEAFLATSLGQHVMPYRAELKIKVVPSDFHTGVPEFIIDEETGGEIITIRHAKESPPKKPEERKAFHEWLRQFIIETALQIIIVSDPDNFTKRIIHDEQGLERAINYSEIDIAESNIFGDAPKILFSDWKPKEGKQKFMLLRGQPWNFDLENTIRKPKEPQLIKFGEGKPPNKLFGIDNLKHKDRRVISLINIPLWDKAKWTAIAYIFEPHTLPMIALSFVNAEATIRIFKGLKKRLGEQDKDDLLRVTVITGVDRKHPAHYRVVISTNLESLAKSKSNFFIIVSRVQSMEPLDQTNLNNFLEQYKHSGKYVFLPAIYTSENLFPEPLWELGIVKQQLILREAWQIGRHDPDVVAIHEDDDPIIPNGVTDAPVIQALLRFKKQKRRKRH